MRSEMAGASGTPNLDAAEWYPGWPDRRRVPPHVGTTTSHLRTATAMLRNFAESGLRTTEARL